MIYIGVHARIVSVICVFLGVFAQDDTTDMIDEIDQSTGDATHETTVSTTTPMATIPPTSEPDNAPKVLQLKRVLP